MLLNSLIKLSSKLSDNEYYLAIKRSFINSTPIILIGAIGLILLNMPMPGYSEFMSSIFSPGWQVILNDIVNISFKLISLYISIQIIINITYNSKILKRKFIDPKIASIVCIAGCFFMIYPSSGDFISIFNVTGLFQCLISSIFCVKIFELAVQLLSKNASSIIGEYEDIDTRKTVITIVPACISFIIFIFVKILLNMPILTYLSDKILNDYILSFALSHRNSLGAAILFMISVHAMWFCGIHGSDILEPITMVAFSPNASENAKMIAEGLHPQFIVTKQFFDVFVIMGGAGCTLALVIAILIVSRKSVVGKFVKTSGLISLFNINELIIYGLPIIFNPVYIIPFIGVPVILTIVTYTAIASGLVPYISNPDVVWTCPIILGGYYATGSFAGVLLQLVNITIATICYIPFVRISRKLKIVEAKKMMNNIVKDFNSNILASKLTLDYSAPERMIAELLANDIKSGIENEEFYLIYQPLVLKDEVVGAEALLRWKHPVYGEIPTMIILTLAKEFGYLADITKWIISTVFYQSKRWQNMYALRDLDISENFRISMNISLDQISCFDWISYTSNKITEYGINPKNIELEITEELAFDRSEYNLNILNGLVALGFDISIDNFGMGYTSLIYLCSFKISEIKIDGDIIKSVLENPKALNVIRAIFDMCRTLDIRCVAKMPENIEQLEAIGQLGVLIYQGYFYSRPLLPKEFEDFVNNKFNKPQDGIYDDVINNIESEDDK